MEDICGNVLLDACFLIEANSKPEVFGEFIAEQKREGKSLLSIFPVKAEFVRTKSPENFKIKSEYYDKVVEVTLGMDNVIQEYVLEYIKEYGNDIEGVSLTDLYLAATLKKYKKNLCLLTANHKDFPVRLFKRLSIKNFEVGNYVKTYAFYRAK